MVIGEISEQDQFRLQPCQNFTVSLKGGVPALSLKEEDRRCTYLHVRIPERVVTRFQGGLEQALLRGWDPDAPRDPVGEREHRFLVLLLGPAALIELNVVHGCCSG
jgi:hypothetical protein